METPFADSTHVQDRTEDSVQLSSVISDQLRDRQTLAENAEKNFKDWDKDKNGSLTLPELSNVYGSSEFSDQDRATASILSENYSLFGSLCAPKLPDDPSKQTFTKFGYNFLESTFGSDAVQDGITQKDLNVFSMLAANEGEQKFIKDAENSENQSKTLHGVLAGVNGVLALALLPKIFVPGPLGYLTAAAVGLSAGSTISSGSKVIDGMRKNDLQSMEKEFQRRKAMLDSLEGPKL